MRTLNLRWFVHYLTHPRREREARHTHAFEFTRRRACGSGVSARASLRSGSAKTAAAAAGAFVVAVPGEHSRGHDFSMASLVVDSLADRRLYLTLGIA